MQFTKEALAELRAIYEHELGKEITDDEAVEIGNRAVAFVQIVIRESRMNVSPSASSDPDTSSSTNTSEH